MTYRSFDTETWRDPWFENLSPMAKLLFIHLWTNDAVNQAGLYQITKKRIEFESGVQVDDVISELKPKVTWDPNQNIVWVKNFCKRQCANPKFFIGAIKQLKGMPNGFINDFIQYNAKLFQKYGIKPPTLNPDTVSEGYKYGIDTHPISGTGTGTDTDKTLEQGECGQKPSTDPQKTKKFVPPTLDQVTAYCQKRQNSVNPKKFISHYTSNGWRVGKTKMVNWKAAVHSWELDSKSKYSGDWRQNQNVEAANAFLKEEGVL